MSGILDLKALRLSTPDKQANLLRKSITTTSIEDVTEILLQAVERGSLSAPVFHVWLGVTRSPFALKKALEQDFSVGVRRCAIGTLRKKLHSAQWREIWDGLGGTPGLVRILAEFSVREVRQICRIIGASSTGKDVMEKREKYSELLEALMPPLFPDVTHQTEDERPLSAYYRLLAPGSKSDVAREILMMKGRFEGGWPQVKNRLFLKCHDDTIKDLVMDSVLSGSELPGWLFDLFWGGPYTKQSLTGFAYLRELSLEVLRAVVEKGAASNISPTRLNEWIFNRILRPLTRRGLKRSRKRADEQEVIELALKVFEKYPKLSEEAKELLLDSHGLVQLLAIRWTREPEMYEKSLTRALVLAIGTGKPVPLTTLVELMVPITAASRRRPAAKSNYQFLHFCYSVIAARNLDLEEDLKHLEIGGLPYDLLFTHLQPAEALALFVRLRNAKGSTGIVEPGPYGSAADIYTNHYSYSWSSDNSAVTDVIHVLLLHCNGKAEEAEATASVHIEKHKEKAITSSTQPQRA